jgi:hypothetical protein
LTFPNRCLRKNGVDFDRRDDRRAFARFDRRGIASITSGQVAAQVLEAEIGHVVRAPTRQRDDVPDRRTTRVGAWELGVDVSPASSAVRTVSIDKGKDGCPDPAS